jgi:hypothetical protein
MEKGGEEPSSEEGQRCTCRPLSQQIIPPDNDGEKADERWQIGHPSTSKGDKRGDGTRKRSTQEGEKHMGYVRSAPNKILMDRKQGDKRFHQSPVRKGEGGKVANGSDLWPH